MAAFPTRDRVVNKTDEVCVTVACIAQPEWERGAGMCS